MVSDDELYEAFNILMTDIDNFDDFAESKITEKYSDKDMTEAIANKIELEGEDLGEEYINSFKPEFLHRLLSTDGDFIENDKLNTKYHIRDKQKGDLTIFLVEDITAKYEGFEEIPKHIRDSMVKQMLKLSGVAGGVKTADLEEAVTDDSKSIQVDIKRLNTVLGNFLNETGKRLTYKNTIEEDMDITRASLKNKNVQKKDITSWKYVIENQTPAIQRTLHPLMTIIRTFDKVEDKIIHLDADHIIGELDLKRLDSRLRIYKFWRGQDAKYNDFKTAYNECHQAFGPIHSMLIEGQNEEDSNTKEIREIIDKFLSFKTPINSDELNYIIKIKPQELGTYLNRNKGLMLFEQFIVDSGLGTEGFDPEKNSEERQARQEGYYTEDGDWKDSVTVEGDSAFGDSDTQQRDVESAEQQKEMEELSRFGLKLKKISTKVDPLFYHAFTKDSGVFKDSVAFVSDVKAMRESMLGAGASREMATGIDLDDEINAYMDDIEKSLAKGGNGPYYLPLSETLNKFLITESWSASAEDRKLNTETGIKNRLSYIGDFLDNLSHILDAGDDLDRASSPSKATVGSSSKGVPSLKTPHLGTKNNKNYLKDIEEAREEFNDLIEEVLDFFVVPMSGSHKPFDDEYPFDTQTNKTRRIFRALATGKTDTALFKVLALEGRAGYMMVKANELEDLTRMLEFLGSVDDNKDIGRLVNELSKGIKAVNFVLLNKKNSDSSLETNVEFGTYLHKVLEANNIDWPEGELFPNSRGKTPKEWSEMYEEGKVYPFEAIESHIKRNVDGYSSSKRTMVRGSDRRATGSNTIIQRFISAVDDMKILRSDTNSKLLEAHDNIRKMLGRPVYYNAGKINNYEHVDSAIQIMKSKYRVDVSAHEVEAIVTGCNSMEELSKNHGVPKEGVYFLKANFR